MRVKFELTGTMPFLMHSNDVEQGDRLINYRKDPANKNLSKPGDDRSPPWTWMTYVYSDGEFITVPSHNLMACLRKAASDMIMKGKKTFKAASQSGILIDSEFMTFKTGGKQIAIADLLPLESEPFPAHKARAVELGFKLDIRRVAVGTSQHIRVRPRFDNWSINGALEVLLPEITFDVLATMFELAGKVGLGDWRPGAKSPGPFGMFSAKLSK